MTCMFNAEFMIEMLHVSKIFIFLFLFSIMSSPNVMIREVFQFIAGNSPSLSEILLTIPPENHSLVLDMEDALQNVLQAEQTAGLKAAARSHLAKCILHRQGMIRQHLGIRINAMTTSEFQKDLELLIALGPSVTWHCIIVPKVSSYEELKDYVSIFKLHGIQYKELIPIIETVKGLQNVAAIFGRKVSDSLFHRAFWGHHDYNLDAGNWPFAEHEDADYWRLTGNFTSLLKRNGYGYINGAICCFNNTTLLRNILARIYRLYGNEFDQAALSYGQAELFRSLQNNRKPIGSLNLNRKTISQEESIRLAEQTLLLFERKHRADKSFVTDKEDGFFISPQMYLAARRFLQSIAA